MLSFVQMAMPSNEEEEETTEKTRLALEALINGQKIDLFMLSYAIV